MKKFISFITLVVILISSLTACGCKHEWTEASCEFPKTCNLCAETEGESLGHQGLEETKACSVCGLDERSIDERFMDKLAKGLEARWVLVNADEGKTSTKADYERYYNAEYDEISEFEHATFEDPNLDKWAKEYINSIVRSKEALSYFGTNQWNSKYAEIYNVRVLALYKINSIYFVPVSKENESTLIGMVSEGEVIDMTADLFKQVEFKLAKDNYGTKTYEAVVENTTTVTFSYFAFEIDLIDKDGVTIDTESAYVENWNPGERMRFSFWTSEEFEEMIVNYAYWNY